MFYLKRPTTAQLDVIAGQSGELPFTQPQVSATRDANMRPPKGFVIDRYGVVLGHGRAVFDSACAAVRRFAMYPPAWTGVHFPGGDAEIREGLVFVSVIRHFGFYSALPCRIVYVVNEPIEFGFALGTLPGHAECGEERFWVSWNPSDDQVRYDVIAYSTPRAWLARLGYPVVRMLQKRFARDSQENMIRAVKTRHSDPD